MAHSRSPSTSSTNDTSTTNSSGTSGGSGSKTNYRPVPVQPTGIWLAWSKVETLGSYMWLVIQLVLLVAGLTVLQISIGMVTLTYIIYGYLKGRKDITG